MRIIYIIFCIAFFVGCTATEQKTSQCDKNKKEILLDRCAYFWNAVDGTTRAGVELSRSEYNFYISTQEEGDDYCCKRIYDSHGSSKDCIESKFIPEYKGTKDMQRIFADGLDARREKEKKK